MAAFLWLISSICVVLYIVESCSPGWPSDGTIYIGNVQLLQDPNQLLISINVESLMYPDSYCKIMNVSDGTVSMAMNSTMCNGYTYRTRSWSNPDTDPSSTSIINVTDMNNGTVHIQLKRNNQIIVINETLSNEYSNLFYEQFTLSSMNTTFVLLASYSGIGEMIVIQFVSQSNNTMIYSSNIGPPTGLWYEWDVTDSPNRIFVYEDVMTIKVPLIPGPCDAYFIASLQFNYNTSNGYIENVIMSKTDQGSLMDNIGKKAYDWGFYGKFVKVWDLEQDTMNTVYLDLSKTMTPTLFPTIQPTFEPSLEPTIYPTVIATQIANKLICDDENIVTIMVELSYILQNNVETESMSDYNHFMFDIMDGLIIDALNECIVTDYNLLIVIDEERQNVKLNLSLCTECNERILADDITDLMKDFVSRTNKMFNSNPMLRVQSIWNIKENQKDGEVMTMTTTTEWIEDVVINNKSDGYFWIILGVIFGFILLCILVFGIVVFVKYRMDKQIYRANTDNIQVCVDENNSNIGSNMSSVKNDDGVITKGMTTIGIEDKISKQFDNLMVSNWLNSIGFVKYLHLFIENGYDSLDIIKEINDGSELLDIGISAENDQIQIIHAIEILKGEGNKTETCYD